MDKLFCCFFYNSSNVMMFCLRVIFLFRRWKTLSLFPLPPLIWRTYWEGWTPCPTIWKRWRASSSFFLFFFLVCLHSPTSHPHALRRYHSSYLQADTPLLDSNCDKASSGRWTLQLFLFFVRRHLSGGVMLRDVCQLVLWLMCKKTIQCKGGVNNILPMRGRCYLFCLILPRGTVVD